MLTIHNHFPLSRVTHKLALLSDRCLDASNPFSPQCDPADAPRVQPTNLLSELAM